MILKLLTSIILAFLPILPMQISLAPSPLKA